MALNSEHSCSNDAASLESWLQAKAPLDQKFKAAEVMVWHPAAPEDKLVSFGHGRSVTARSFIANLSSTPCESRLPWMVKWVLYFIMKEGRIFRAVKERRKASYEIQILSEK